MATKEFDLSGFSGISVKLPAQLDVVSRDSYGITVTGNETVVNSVKVSLEGDRLLLAYKYSLASVVALPFSQAHITVNMPVLKELDVSGAARCSVKGFISENPFRLRVAGASQLSISDTTVGNMEWDLSGAGHIRAQVKAANVDIKIAGASWLELSGTGQDIRVDAAGASHIDLKNFPVRNASFKLSGASRSNVNMNGKLDVALDGASGLEYEGQVDIGEVKVTGASTLKRR